MRRDLKHLFCSVLLLLAFAGQAIAQAPARTSEPPPGILVEIGNHKMHIFCTGENEGGPTVILEAGGGNFSNAWSQVQELLPSTVRVCSYDRAGLGWSGPGPSPRTMHQEVFELHALLYAINVSKPLILVGHSIGGLLARLYTEQFDNDVAGMVLIDSAHEDQVLFSLNENRWVRVRDLSKGRAIPTPRLEGPLSLEYNPEEDYQGEEFYEIYVSRKARPEPLGERPLIVLSAGKRPTPPGTDEEVWSDLRIRNDGWRVDLTRLSSNSKFILAANSGHNINVESPQLVSDAIHQVVLAVTTGSFGQQ